MQRVQQRVCFVMAAEDGEGLRVIAGEFAYAGAFKEWAPFDDGDAIALTGEAVGSGETGRVSSKNHDGLGVGGCHEDLERNHTPAATASR
jgi:hypothetical protein